MLNIIDRSEKLWQECAKLAQSPGVIDSELFDTPDDHYVLAYGPVAQRNQFQALLYSACDRFNVSLLPIHKLELFGDIPWPAQVVCHFHWIHEQTKQAKTEKEADAAVVYWEKLIRRIKKNGRKIVWTVHNVIPHECMWVEQDKKIHQMMADAADALHVMASDSAWLTKPYYMLDERKMFVVPHPTYEGAQPDEITGEDARRKLRIAKDEFVFLSFGAIMAYKGYVQLMAAYDQLRDKTTKPIRLIIAGLPSDKALGEEITAWGSDKPDVILDLTPVPRGKLQVYFRSADVAVCPYTRTLNSGAAMMAVTFGVLVLGPNSGSFVDIEASGCGLTYSNLGDNTLAEKMQLLVGHKRLSPEKLAKAKQVFAPSAISDSFFSKMKAVVA